MEESDPSEDQGILLPHPTNTWNHLKSLTGSASSPSKVYVEKLKTEEHGARAEKVYKDESISTSGARYHFK